MSESESGSKSDPAQPDVPTTKVLGLWIDPLTKVGGHIDKSKLAKVGQTVRSLTKSVIKRVNMVTSSIYRTRSIIDLTGQKFGWC